MKNSKKDNQKESQLLNEDTLLNLFFDRSTSGFFFMMLDEPIIWNEQTDKEKTLEYIFDHQHVTKANQTLLDQYGYREEEYIGKTPRDLFSHNIEQGKEIWRNFFNRRHLRYVTDERRKDGTHIWIEGEYMCLTDNQDRIIGHFGVQNDITKRVHQNIITKNNEIRVAQSQQLVKLGHWEINLKTKIVWGSIEAQRIYGLVQDSEYFSLQTIQDVVDSNDREKLNQALINLIEKNKKYDVEFKIYQKHTNQELYVHSVAVLKHDDLGHPTSIIGTIQDNTAQNQMELEIQKKANESNIQKNILSATLNSIGDGVIATDANGNVTSMNPIASELTKWSVEDAEHQPFENVFRIINETTRLTCKNPVKSVLEKQHTVELENHTILIAKDGKELFVEDCASPIEDSKHKIIGVVLIFRDVTDKKQKQREIEYMSNHDFLTDIYNRRFYVESYQKFDQKQYFPLGIMMIDVNGLKIINDAYGHDTGDYALKKVADALKLQFSKSDIISRIGGDEFAILVPNTTIEKMYEIKNELRNEIQQIYVQKIPLSVAIGYELKENDEQTLDELLKLAEKHMYSHKLSEGVSVRNHAIKAILATLTEKYAVEKKHSTRVSQICRLIGEKMDLPQDDLTELEQAGMFHDIGKISIPDEILNKPGKLTEKEYNIIKTHTEIGYTILRAADEYSDLAIHALYHHERWDGKGYPKGLKETDIPLFCRIISVVDAYEAMTADRPYRSKLTKEYAIDEIKRCSGSQFDPQIAALFVKMLENNNIE